MVEEISKTVEVDEMQFGGLFILQEDNMLVIASRPDWVRHPVNGSKVYVKDMFVLKEAGCCPNCKVAGKHGLVLLENNEIIICCVACKQFVWVEIKND